MTATGCFGVRFAALFTTHMELRDYQQDCVTSILREWEENDSTLAVLPTGSGKSIIFAEVIKRTQPARAMVLAHREELIWQARDKIERTTGLECEIEMADLSARTGPTLFSKCPVVISTIQTQNSKWRGQKRMGKFNPEEFGVLIIDESHHVTASSYLNVINYYTQNPKLRVLGVTATPDRTDQESLGRVFKTVAYDYEILDAIHDGWLVDIDQQMVHIEGLDFSAMRTTAGDLNGADLSAVMEAERNLLGVADATLQIIKQRRAIVFTVSVRQAESLANIFNRRGQCAGWVCGKTPKDDRRQMLADFAAGKIQIMVNCGVLTEGFDDPGVEVVVMARPTKSRSLYSQMIGRSTRPLAGVVDGIDSPVARRKSIAASPKPSCLVVDFAGNAGRHKLITTADILGGKVSDYAMERALAKAKKLGKPVRMAEELDLAEAFLRAEKARTDERLRRMAVQARANFTTKAISPFDAFDIHPCRERPWDRGKTLSEKQRNILIRQGIDPDSMPYHQGKQILLEIFRRWDQKQCSFGQAKLLRSFGLPCNMSAADAKRTLDSVMARNGKPPVFDSPNPRPAPAAPAPVQAKPRQPLAAAYHPSDDECFETATPA